MFDGSRLRRFLGLIIGISIPFNSVALSFAGRDWSLGFLTIALYFCSCLPLLGKYSQKLFECYSRFIFLPVIFYVLLVFVNVINANQIFNTPVMNSSMLNCLFYFYFLLIHAASDKLAIYYPIYGIALGGFIMSVLFVMGVGVEIDPATFRLRMFDSNENELGIFTSMGIVIILYCFIIQDAFHVKTRRFLFLILIPSMIGLLLATASRTAFGLIIVSILLIVILHPYKKPRFRFVTLSFFFIFSIVFLNALFSEDYSILTEEESAMTKRLTDSVSDADMSGRDEIWLILLPEILKNPVFGIGETGYAMLANEKLGEVSQFGDSIFGYSPHNVLIETLIYTGIVGFSLMGLFWLKLSIGAWSVFRHQRSIMELLLLLPILFVLLSAQIFSSKWAYLFYAFIIVSYSSMLNNKLVHRRI